MQRVDITSVPHAFTARLQYFISTFLGTENPVHALHHALESVYNITQVLYADVVVAFHQHSANQSINAVRAAPVSAWLL